MINAKFKAGKYYIGDLAKILDYSNLSILELGFGILNEFKYLNFELECDEKPIIVDLFIALIVQILV